MGGVILVLCILLLSSCSKQSAGSSGLSLSAAEQQNMDGALLRYAFTNKETSIYANANDFDFYIRLQGREPTRNFLDSLDSRNGKLKPWSYANAALADPKKNFIGSGHNVMQVTVGTFEPVANNTFEAKVDLFCGPLCGSHNRVNLRKLDGQWSVTSFATDRIE
jgi:hypothetical protein